MTKIMLEGSQTQALIFTSLKVELKWLRSFSTPGILASLAYAPEKLPGYTVFVSLFTDLSFVEQTILGLKFGR